MINKNIANKISEFAFYIGQNLRLRTTFGYNLKVSDNLEFIAIQGGKIEESICVKGLFLLAEPRCLAMPRYFKNPKILLLKSFMDETRIKNLKSFDFMVKKEKEYIEKCALRILQIEPNLIFLGESISHIAAEILVERQVTVLCDISESKMRALSLCTGASIVKSPEGLVYATLGTCDEFCIETIFPQPNSIVYLKNCPFPSYFSVLFRPLESSKIPRVKAIFDFAVSLSFYNKYELYFIKSIFPDFDFEKNIFSNIDLETLRYTFSFIASSHKLSILRNKIEKLDSSHSSISMIMESDSLEKSEPNIPVRPTNVCSLINKLSPAELSDVLSIYRLTSDLEFAVMFPFQGFTSLPKNLDERTSPKINLSLDSQLKTASFSCCNFDQKINKLNPFQISHYLFFKYSRVSSSELLPCINPKILKLSFNHSTDMFLKDFLKFLIHSDFKCPKISCEIPFKKHSLIFAQENRKIKLTFQPATDKNINQNNISLSIKCSICKNVRDINLTCEISVSIFFKCLISSKSLFTCQVCQTNPHKVFGNFVFGFNIENTCIVFKTDEIMVKSVFVPIFQIFDDTVSKKIDRLSLKLQQLDTSKRKSIEVLISLLKNIDETDLKLNQIITHACNHLLVLSQSITDIISTILTSFNELKKKYMKKSYIRLDEDISACFVYLFVNVNHFLKNIKKHKKLSKKLSIFKYGDYSKYRYITHVTINFFKSMYQEKGNSLDLAHQIFVDKEFTDMYLECKIKERSEETQILSEFFYDCEKETQVQASDDIKIPQNSHIIYDENFVSDSEQSEILILPSDFSVKIDQLGSNEYIPVNNDEKDKVVSFNDILPFTTDFHVIQFKSKLFIFFDSKPSTIISTALEIFELIKPTINNLEKIEPGLDKNEDIGVYKTTGVQYTDIYRFKTVSYNTEGILKNNSSNIDSIDDTIQLSSKNPSNYEIEFFDHDYKYTCLLYRHTAFLNLRDKIFKGCVFTSFVESLSDCKVWDASGGKSKSVFYKTFDDRFVIKQISQIEAKCFEDFLDSYIDYLQACMCDNKNTGLCKIFGMFKICQFVGSNLKSQNFYIVIENAFCDFKTDKIYDIKGCQRNIKNLKENILLESDILRNLCHDPIYINHLQLSEIHKVLLRDTRFLEENFIVDYSLIFGVNKTTNTIKMGIIDYLRKYTWDKRLESAVKSGLLLATAPGRTPTIVSPIEYRMRFMDAIKLYFYPVPSLSDHYEIMKSGCKYDSYFINIPEEEKYNLSKSPKPIHLADIIH